jgi:hypothetical protein
VIITNLIGGLGNQMFQYAIGRALAIKHDTELVLDIRGFEQYKLHRFGLRHLNVVGAVIETDEDLQDLHKQIIANHRWNEKFYHYDPLMDTAHDNLYINGYWQCEKYFINQESVLRKDFSMKYNPDPENQKFSEWITGCESVSIHVRRGDYVTNSHTNQFHGTCSLEYYQACIAELAKNVRSPHFFVFSDDIDWVKKNLVIPHPVTYLGHNGADRNYEDLRLMSLCKHNIIANSSFSWWGAWLNQNKAKVVICPSKWFAGSEPDTKDLIPDSWIKI